MTYQRNGVRVFSVPGRPDLMRVEYHRFKVHDGSGKTRLITLEQGLAALSDDVKVASVVVARVMQAETIEGDEVFLKQAYADEEFSRPVHRIEDDSLVVGDPPNPCGCPCCPPSNCSSCSWGCLKSCYQ
jgi:hypothetical protein